MEWHVDIIGLPAVDRVPQQSDMNMNCDMNMWIWYELWYKCLFKSSPREQTSTKWQRWPREEVCELRCSSTRCLKYIIFEIHDMSWKLKWLKNATMQQKNLWKAKILYPSEAHGRSLLNKILDKNIKNIKNLWRHLFCEHQSIFEFCSEYQVPYILLNSPDHRMMKSLLKRVHPTLFRYGKCQVSCVSKPIGGEVGRWQIWPEQDILKRTAARLVSFGKGDLI